LLWIENLIISNDIKKGLSNGFPVLEAISWRSHVIFSPELDDLFPTGGRDFRESEPLSNERGM
jgi:hypothetical protein